MAKIKGAGGPGSFGIVRRSATVVVLTEYSFDPRAIEPRLAAGCKVRAEPKDPHAYHITFDVYSDTKIQEKTGNIVGVITEMEGMVKQALGVQRALMWLREDPCQHPVCTKLSADLHAAFGDEMAPSFSCSHPTASCCPKPVVARLDELDESMTI